MSYQVLSRKYRPQLFEDVVGQVHVSRTLQNALKLDRVAHGFMFTGPRGVGKTTIARILAKSLNCSDAKDDNPCSKCTNCIEITNGRSMDVLEIDGASNRGIDEIRELREAVKYPPTTGKYRIYIIDEVHMLTGPAFNALLKTLEEPPPHVVFMMATTDPQKVPQTILSRTQRFDLKRLNINDIVDHLKNILTLEKIKYDEESLKLIAKKADGSMRDSLSLLDQVISYSGDLVELDIVREILGVLKDSVYLELLQDVTISDNNSIIGNLSKIIESGYSITDFVSGFNNFIRNCLLATVGENEASELSEETVIWLQGSDCILESMDLLRILDISLEFESKLRYLQQPKVALEALFLKLSAMDTSVSITQLLNGDIPTSVKKTEVTKNPIKSKVKTKTIQPVIENKADTKVAKPKNVISEEVKPSVSKQEKNISIEAIQLKWNYIIESLDKINTKTAQFLDESEVKELQNRNLLILLKNSNGFELKSLEKDSSMLEKLLSDEFGVNLKVKYKSNAPKQTQKKTKVKPRNTEHPLFMKVIETLDGEIIR
ncbi:MAG: DNA polymerase III subunit gamma/tau [Candidatus Marinimicrobia bacterium]|nr:DNA polymerase III subunit gamma/tau [Candidatus Neomarinimicrobiota bacterium]MBL7023623.1 DNA polymerase III subunit gamma/tau [Candidatus Neomarinimicrobiota bacterium]MBL7109810.1 DNA polymerase III subunit gamma/tau [Candidatus Neomarinimicrobiota bacterium]